MSETTTQPAEQEATTSLRVLDVLHEDERPSAAPADAAGDDAASSYEVDAEAFYERGFAIARALRAWRNHEGDGPHPGLPAPSGIEQAVDRVCAVPDGDFDAGYRASVDQVQGEQALGRARAIEAVRLLMTALIRQQSGGPINLHITSDEASRPRWRLFPEQPALDF